MTKGKKSDTKKALTELNAKKVEKELRDQVNYSANNAEKAFVLMDEMVYGDANLYDIVFSDKAEVAMKALSPERKKEYLALAMTAKKSEDSDELGSKIMAEFPELIETETNQNFLITKVLRFNGKHYQKITG